MISMCPRCGSSRWNKTATATHITCPECGHSWPYRRGPLLLLTGCSGVGKTTTAIRLFRLTKDFAVLPPSISRVQRSCGRWPAGSIC